MNKFVVITTIHPPTISVKAFARRNDCRLLVVGDKKTPQDWHAKDAVFISARDQERSGDPFIPLLPWNHYSRKMIGYLAAIHQQATMIVDTDDDNLPYENWGFPSFEGRFTSVFQKKGFVNIYEYFTRQKIWPRGLPLHVVTASRDWLNSLSETPMSIGVWQGLADGDPDVDAIYRLTDNASCIFDVKEPITLSPGAICPFNSQNTAFRKEVFPLLYLPASVTFRFTDILRGLVAQPILWAAGYHLGFTKASVFQERNVHDYMKDFESEIPCYLHGERVVGLCSKATRGQDSIGDNLYRCYEELLKQGIVAPQEMDILSAWLKALSGSP